MQHLGRADAVEDVDAEALAASARRSPRGSASPAETQSAQTDSVERAAAPAPRASRRRASARRRRSSAGARRSTLEHRVRRRPLGHQHARRADAERERHRVAEPVGEEELGRRERRSSSRRCRGPLARRARPQYTMSCCRCTAPLGRPVEPESRARTRDRPWRRRRPRAAGSALADPVVEARSARRSPAARHHHVARGSGAFGEHRARLGEQRLRDDRRPGRGCRRGSTGSPRPRIMVFTGTGIAPILIAPQNAARNSGGRAAGRARAAPAARRGRAARCPRGSPAPEARR